MGWYETGLLFVLVIFLWPALLALAFLVWAKRRRDLN
jgi:LPXTG-motif cell wall-anchored protein